MDFTEILAIVEDAIVYALTKISSFDFTGIDTSFVAKYASMLAPTIHKIVEAVGQLIAGL